MTKPKLMPSPVARPSATPKRALCEIESEKYDSRFQITKHPSEPAINETPTEAMIARYIKSSINYRIKSKINDSRCRVHKDTKNDPLTQIHACLQFESDAFQSHHLGIQ